MIKKIFVPIFLTVIILGVIGFSLNTFFGGARIVTYVEIKEINGITLYTYNFRHYLDSIQNQITNTPEITINLPQRTWQATNNFVEDIANNLQVIVNYIILGLNFLIWPFRAVFFILRFLITIVGINIDPNYTHPLSWLVNITQRLATMEIPYL